MPPGRMAGHGENAGCDPNEARLSLAKFVQPVHLLSAMLGVSSALVAVPIQGPANVVAAPGGPHAPPAPCSAAGPRGPHEQAGTAPPPGGRGAAPRTPLVPPAPKSSPHPRANTRTPGSKPEPSHARGASIGGAATPPARTHPGTPRTPALPADAAHVDTTPHTGTKSAAPRVPAAISGGDTPPTPRTRRRQRSRGRARHRLGRGVAVALPQAEALLVELERLGARAGRLLHAGLRRKDGCWGRVSRLLEVKAGASGRACVRGSSLVERRHGSWVRRGAAAGLRGCHLQPGEALIA